MKAGGCIFGSHNLSIVDNIYSACSKDGLNWSQIEVNLGYQRWNFNERNAVAFPFVTRLGNEGYRMYYMAIGELYSIKQK